jgi:hypothetical protein
MYIEQRIEYLEKQLAILEMQCKQQPEFEYPIYMQSKEHKRVVKFTGRTDGCLVVADEKGTDSKNIDRFGSNWISHTDENHWQPITFDEERGIADKQLVDCYISLWSHVHALAFYDAVNECTFDRFGNRNGSLYDKYHPIPYADYPDWAIEAEKTLED